MSREKETMIIGRPSQHSAQHNTKTDIASICRNNSINENTNCHTIIISKAKMNNEESKEEEGHVHQAHRNRHKAKSSASLHSLLQSEDGIILTHHHDTDELIANIPDRFDKQSRKAKLKWFGLLCVTGLGMFVEAYVIITTGQIKTVWKDQYPACWAPDHDVACPNNIRCCGLFPNTPSFDENGTCAVDLNDDYSNGAACQENGEYPDSDLCQPAVTGSISYAEFAGIMAGMIAFGALLDKIGRKSAGMLTSSIMIAGIAGMTYFGIRTNDTQTLFVVFSVFFGLFGFGVGGEYPLTASGAAEHHHTSVDSTASVSPAPPPPPAPKMDGNDDNDNDHAARLHRHQVLQETAKSMRRGETIAMVFAMQGVGAVFGSTMLLSLIVLSNQGRVDCDHYSTNESGNDPNALGAVWRSFYLLGLIFIIMLLLYRYLVLEEGKGYLQLQERKKLREQKLGSTGIATTFRLLRFYSFRLIGTGGNWFLTDIMFYGLKLYSGPIFAGINPNGDLITNNGWILVNNIISLFGYYGASRLVDKKRVGRKKLQLYCFVIIVAIFFISAAVFDSAPVQAVMFLFFMSGFFINLGPNTTTYMMAAETYPTELRGTMHGASAFMGKAGALTATVVFGGMSTTAIFWMCGGAGILGAIVTFLFSVDLTQASLTEHDAQLELFLEGRLDVYKGKLNAPEHLSMFEKWTGWHGAYDPLWAAKLVEAEKDKGGYSSSLGRGVLGFGDAVEVVSRNSKVE